MTTGTSEKGLESLIMRHMTGAGGLAITPGALAETPASKGGAGYVSGSATSPASGAFHRKTSGACAVL